LTTEQIKRGLDILKKLDVVDIVFSGGNPLLRDDIDEILRYASRSFVTTIYDNGSMAVKKIEALRHVDFVAISLDTMDAEKCDYAKGVEGSWDKAIQAIETLRRENVFVSVSPTISQFNIREIVDLTNHFLRKGIPVWYCLYSFDTSVDSDQLFKIGRRNDEFEIADREAMVRACDSLIDMKKNDSNILITSKTLKAVKQLFLDGRRTWKCRALQNFFMIDHLGRVAGCHLRKPVVSIFDLPNAWDNPEIKTLRRTYRECDNCVYLCYIFYSIHGSVIGNLQLAQDRWKNAKLLLRKSVPMLPSSGNQQQ